MIGRLWSVFQESAHTFEGQEKDERVILLLRRHPFVALFPVSSLGLIALLPILVFLAFYSSLTNSEYLTLFFFVSSLFYMALWVLAFYFLMMYSLNTVVVTNRRIIDRDQNGFFNRKVSELHIYRIQDITVSTKGLVPTLLHYGDVIVQTAGNEQKFIFHEMPNPEDVKTEIMRVASMANAGVKPIPPALAAESVNNS